MWCEKEVSYRNGIDFFRVHPTRDPDPDPDPILFLRL